MGWIIITALLLAAAFIAWVWKKSVDRSLTAEAKALADHAAVPDNDYLRRRPSSNESLPIQQKVARIALVVALAIIGLETLGFSFTTVSTKNVGVQTAFGKTAGFLSNGAHLIPPWDGVTEMDAAIQTDSFTTSKGDFGSPITVRIGNQQTASVSVSIRWRINPDYADALFQNYRTFENVQDSLVVRELTAAVNQQFANYNPLNSVATTNPGDKRNPPLNVIANRVTSQMKHEIGKEGIVVLGTIIPLVTFDPATQARINQLQQQFALTRIAQQEKLTNQAQAQANKALAASVNTSPNVLVAQCFTILGEMVKQGQAVPPAFSCWPGGGKIGILAGASGK